jgi:transcriptional regulator with XRE-family HTH domain
MNQVATIMEMKSLGFSQEHIARHLGLSNEQVSSVIRQNTISSRSKRKIASNLRKEKGLNDRPPVSKSNKAIPQSPLTEYAQPHPILEVKPGFYILTAEDLIAFASRMQPHSGTAEPDPYLDYVQKDHFLEQYGISEKTLQRHQKDGLLKVYKLGNKLYLKKSQVVIALEKGQL